MPRALGSLARRIPDAAPPGAFITSITPNTDYDFGGTAVTIVGAGFTGATSVGVGSALLTSLVVVDDNTITGVTGDADEPTVAVNVNVSTPSGVITGYSMFTYWSPKSLSNLAHWLDAHLSVTITQVGFGDVSRWNDRSGNSRDVFAASGEEPKFLATAPPGSVVGNTVEFDDSTGTKWLKTDTFNAADAYTVFTVSNRVTGTNTVFYEHVSPGVPTKGFEVGYGSVGDSGVSPTYDTYLGDGSGISGQNVSTINTGWELLRFRGGTGSSFTPEIFQGGSLVSSFSSDGFAGADSGTSDGLGIFGGGGDVAQHCEIIYYDRKLSDADCDLVEAYLDAKWGGALI